MPRVEWKIWHMPGRISGKIREFLQWIMLMRRTLFFNSFTSWSVVLETGFEPLFCTMERFSKYLGPCFMILVVLLTTSVVVIFYICLLPHVYEQSLSKTIFHLIFGHWLLVNIVFNYFMAAFTNPGNPPREVPETVSICKKCISPKPPRAHHCSVCDKCILKMDHHCPWLNNCIGFFNHRYFFQYCCFMLGGTVYVCITGIDLFKQHFYGTKEYPFPAVLYPLNLAYDLYYTEKEPHLGSVGGDIPHAAVLEVDYREQRYHNAVIYEFVICSAVALALSCLVIWHIKMISAAETNIEVHINKKEKERLKKVGVVFKNPYYYGLLRNWRVFFGLCEGRSFWRHVLLPSVHPPLGNGLAYPRAVNGMDHGLQLL